MGQLGAWTSDVYFDDVHVPNSAMIGGAAGLDTGYLTAIKWLAHGRVHIAALCVGMAERLVDETVSYAASREQGGNVIGEYQLIQGLIADSVTDHRAARSLVLDVLGARRAQTLVGAVVELGGTMSVHSTPSGSESSTPTAVDT